MCGYRTVAVPAPCWRGDDIMLALAARRPLRREEPDSLGKPRREDGRQFRAHLRTPLDIVPSAIAFGMRIALKPGRGERSHL